MNIEEAKLSGLKLMEESKAAYLTTIDPSGFPLTRAMFNLRNREQFPEFSEFFENQQNQFSIYISTNTSSNKVAHLSKNPKMCVYFCDPEDFMGFMLGGSAEIIDDIELKKEIWLDWWTRYYPEGLEDPDYTLLRMEPTNARFYYKLNQLNFEL
ncbi:MAG: pyridoxamine 5'-phosphate oxidase family protein [Candidatus Lokiarchaeota archaeon]|nr:pyridoxamine 5'-phosphate oxidase family protein [Candidatus Lokiarchaeota archaeon]